MIDMMDMLTAKEIEELLQVDRSTVYRMAEAGRLPAIKVGKQWRFPKEQVNVWLQNQTNVGMPASRTAPTLQPVPAPPPACDDLSSLLPMECVQLIQASFANALNTMLVVTDMEGTPITEVSNPCGLFSAVLEQPDAIKRCIRSWHDLATMIALEPMFKRSHLGLFCARSMIRVGTELKGMVVTGCIAPEDWPPKAAEIEAMAAEFGVAPEIIRDRLDDVYFLDQAEQEKILALLPQVANIIAHIIDERKQLVGRLEAIAALTTL